MFEQLEAKRSLTANQWRIVATAIIGDMLEFFDYFLIGFVLAFIVGPWQLSFGQSAVILLSSGIGAILGAAIWGRLADRIGRRAVFIGTVLNFSLATGILALTPDHGWIFLTIFRFFVGFGVGGLYCVDLPLVQEFVPASKRGFVGGQLEDEEREEGHDADHREGQQSKEILPPALLSVWIDSADPVVQPLCLEVAATVEGARHVVAQWHMHGHEDGEDEQCLEPSKHDHFSRTGEARSRARLSLTASPPRPGMNTPYRP